MLIGAISDLHGNLPEIPDCDLLLIAGDVCPATNHHMGFQHKWLKNTFAKWLTKLRDRDIFVVGCWGNHDRIAEFAPNLIPELDWVVLNNRLVHWDLNIWGSPWTLEFGRGWAFNKNAVDLAELHSNIPPCDIIVTHGPCYGIGDLAPRLARDASGKYLKDLNGNRIRIDDEHTGCPALTKRITEIEPKLVVFGHIHEGRGKRQLGKTTIANVTHLDASYRPVYDTMLFEIDPGVVG